MCSIEAMDEVSWRVQTARAYSPLQVELERRETKGGDHFSEAMEKVSWRVQKARAYSVRITGCVAADGARVKPHICASLITVDGDTAALHV